MTPFEKVSQHMKLYYNKSMSELEISEVPGYWRDLEPKKHNNHPLHGCIGCESPFNATYVYHDKNRDENGRFASPYRTWKTIKECMQNE
jgi:hypothetical protein